MKNKLVKTAAIVCAMSMLIGGTALASTSKMVTKSGSEKVYSGIVSASTAGFQYTLHPYTNKSLTGFVQQGDTGLWLGVDNTEKKVSSEKTFKNTTAKYTTYRLALTDGTGYGTIQVD